MADEQDWAAYADQANMAATDTVLARTSAGAGVEIPGTAMVRTNASGNAGLGTETVTALFGRTLQIGAGSGNSTLSMLGSGGSGIGDGFLAALVNHFSVTARTDTALHLGAGDSDRLLVQANGNIVPAADNTQNLGGAGNRFATVYAGTGTINTSDEREKVWRGAMTDDEYAAALQIIDELGFYQWKESVDEKGSGARLHFGPRAQRVFAILDDHLGANAWHRYAFACHDEWEEMWEPVYERRTVPAVTDEDGKVVVPQHEAMVDTGETRKVREAGDRYGMRVEQLLMFLLAAQARRQGELEARIALLEV